MSITFSSCFYIIKSKFDPRIYIEWINNLIIQAPQTQSPSTTQSVKPIVENFTCETEEETEE